MNLLITGDLYVADNFGKRKLLDQSILDLFAGADYRIVNLEAPLTIKRKRNRILKTGPHLQMTPDTVLPILRTLNVDLVTLANNHIMDYAALGLHESLANLKRESISFVGAGADLQSAAKPFLVNRNARRLSILNFAENEWSGATKDAAGANPLDIIENSRQIRNAQKEGDIVVVIVHGGIEASHLPSPRMVSRFRYYADSGASVIVAHHTHCIGGYEVYKNVPIFYGLGNFLFTERSVYESWYNGLILKLHIQNVGEISWELIPIRQAKDDHTVAILDGSEKQSIYVEIERFKDIITDELKLMDEWETIIQKRKDGYLNIFSPLNIVQSSRIRYVLYKLGLNRLLITKRHYLQILNCLRCESHSEAAEEVLKKFLTQ